MRKYLLITILCFVATLSHAQSYVSGMFFSQTEFDSNSLEFSIAAEYGKFIKDNAAIGATLEYNYEKDAANEHTIIIQPYYRRYFATFGSVNLFCDGIVGTTVTIPNEGDTALGLKVGLQPGLDMAISEKLHFISKLGFIGYYQPGETKKYVRVSLDATDIMIGLQLRL